MGFYARPVRKPSGISHEQIQLPLLRTYFSIAFIANNSHIYYYKITCQCFCMKCDESDEIQDIVALLNQNGQNTITPPSTVTFAQHDEIQM